VADIYVRIDVNLPDHPKLKAVPKRYRSAALAAYVSALCYCARLLTDGVVPMDAMLTYATRKVLVTLTDVGLIRNQGTCYLIPDYLEWNRSRDEVNAIKQRRRDAGRIGGTVMKQRRKAASATACAGFGKVANANVVPVPKALTETDKTLVTTLPVDNSVDNFGTFWSAYPKPVDRDKALASYAEAIQCGYSPETITVAAEVYAHEGKPLNWIRKPHNWLKDDIEAYSRKAKKVIRSRRIDGCSLCDSGGHVLDEDGNAHVCDHGGGK